MGLNWQHTIWNRDFKFPTDKLLFLFLADNCSDTRADHEFYLDEVADYVGISRRHVARLLEDYKEIVEYIPGKGRSFKSKIKWLIGQKKRVVKVDTKVDTKADIKPDNKVDIIADSKVDTYNKDTTLATHTTREVDALIIFQEFFKITANNVVANQLLETISDTGHFQEFLKTKASYTEEPEYKRKKVGDWIFKAYAEYCQKYPIPKKVHELPEDKRHRLETKWFELTNSISFYFKQTHFDREKKCMVSDGRPTNERYKTKWREYYADAELVSHFGRLTYDINGRKEINATV